MTKIYLLALLFVRISLMNAQTVGLTLHNNGTLDDGYVLFAPINSNTTYLIDKCGRQVKTWNSSYRPGQSVYLLTDGTLLRTGNANNTTFTVGGKGGIIEKIDWNGNVTWSYTLSDATKCQHHDAIALPNGNILVIAWEKKTNTEAIAAGRNPSLVPTTLWSEQIFEIQPIGTNGGNIVWEWHLWDHLVQDFDSSKANYAAIASNPQLVNINYGANATNSDWIHLNSIDYNPLLDQIVVSSHNLDEIWIIDHSTSTAQAASHTGGNSGKGGDILYRWGNPQAYDNGTLTNQKFFGQHNVHWIPNELPFENQLMVFNNGLGRTGGSYSTIDIINPPLSGFNYTASLPYLPSANSWTYNSGNPNNFYAMNISGAQQLSNGNVLICNGPSGTFTEIDSSGTTLWSYINPVNANGIINQGANPIQNLVFRCTYYPSDYTGFDGHTLVSGNSIENSNVLTANCNVLSASENTTDQINFEIYPNPAREFLHIRSDDFSVDDCIVQLFNALGQMVHQEKIISTTQSIPITNLTKGVYLVKISNGNSIKTARVIVED